MHMFITLIFIKIHKLNCYFVSNRCSNLCFIIVLFPTNIIVVGLWVDKIDKEFSINSYLQRGVIIIAEFNLLIIQYYTEILDKTIFYFT